MTRTPIEEIAFGDVDFEIGVTRRYVERVPDQHLDWRPHERSWTLGELATHIVNLLSWQIMMLEATQFDLSVVPRPESGITGRDQLLERFDFHAARLRSRLAELDDDALATPWTLQRGDHVIFTRPRAAALRVVGVNHLVHHRGQLSVYLRLLDVPLPSAYGPSADERGGF